jgi:hypothetical protein
VKHTWQFVGVQQGRPGCPFLQMATQQGSTSTTNRESITLH